MRRDNNRTRDRKRIEWLKKSPAAPIELGDLIEDTYRSFNGEILAVTRGVVTEVREDAERIKYHCSQIHYSDVPTVKSMLGTIVDRSMRTCIVLSSRSHNKNKKVVTSGTKWEEVGEGSESQKVNYVEEYGSKLMKREEDNKSGG
jgi:hypothetical protein